MASTRLSLQASGPVDPKRVALVARRGLGLSADASGRLLPALPLTITVAQVDGPELNRIVAHLRGAGIGVELSPGMGHHGPCVRHPQWVATEVCTRCGQHLACAACLEVEPTTGCAQCVKKDARRRRFRYVRVALLLLVLFAVASGTWLRKQRVTNWNRPLQVGVFPIRGDASPQSEAFVRALGPASFEPVGAFFEAQGRRYGLTLPEPVVWVLGPQVGEVPPAPPGDAGVFRIALWSLTFRYWVFQTLRDIEAPQVDLAVFLVLHSPNERHSLDHSLGLDKVAAAVAHVFADPRMMGSNQVVIAHELLHVLGATDKYDPQTGLPSFPAGYAEPEQSPIYPQPAAEIMGGRIAIGPTHARMPESLSECVVGAATAAEIGWTRAPR